MAEERPTRVAVYIDFDNVVISRYDAMFGRSKWRNDNARDHSPQAGSDKLQEDRLAQATIDVGALLDYAASFGTVALAKAYADWSVPANAAYRRQLVDRAVDLTQLFALGGTKNGADIRLSVDVTADLYQYDDLTHVVIVAGDSDYVALAQRCKQLGRFVVGIGVAGSTARALVAACDDFSDYDDLPGVRPARREPAAKQPARRTSKRAEKQPAKDVDKDAAKEPGKDSVKEPDKDSDSDSDKDSAKEPIRRTRKATRKSGPATEATRPADSRDPDEPDEPDEEPEEDERSDPQSEATALLLRAIRVALEKSEDEWLNSGGVKSQMQRMNPAFKEKALGYSSFRAFLESRADVETEQTGQQLQVRLTP